jgi:AcrR family transcriptional regulator
VTNAVRRAPGRPRGGERVATREVLLDAAERVIRRGGAGVSLDAIAEEAGVTKPVIYATVGDRTALAGGLASRLSDRIVAASTEAVIRLDGTIAQRDVIAALIEATFTTIAGDRAIFLYVTRGAANSSPEDALLLADRSAAPLTTLLTDWLIRQNRDPAVAIPWAYGIIGMLNLVSLWWTHTPDRPGPMLADQLAELLWTGLSGT